VDDNMNFRIEGRRSEIGKNKTEKNIQYQKLRDEFDEVVCKYKFFKGEFKD